MSLMEGSDSQGDDGHVSYSLHLSQRVYEVVHDAALERTAERVENWFEPFKVDEDLTESGKVRQIKFPTRKEFGVLENLLQDYVDRTPKVAQELTAAQLLGEVQVRRDHAIIAMRVMDIFRQEIDVDTIAGDLDDDYKRIFGTGHGPS